MPNPTARPRDSGGSMRVSVALIVGIPAAETAMPITTPAKKVKTMMFCDSAMPTMPTA